MNILISDSLSSKGVEVGISIVEGEQGRVYSQSGTGRFFSFRKAGLNSLDW